MIGEDGTGKAWEYNEGWLYRKANKFPTPTFNMNDWTACNNCLDNANTHQDAITNGGNTHFPIKTISYPKAGSYSSVNAATLNVTNVLFAQNGNIRGFIYDQETGEPIMFCNVFLKELQ